MNYSRRRGNRDGRTGPAEAVPSAGLFLSFTAFPPGASWLGKYGEPGARSPRWQGVKAVALGACELLPRVQSRELEEVWAAARGSGHLTVGGRWRPGAPPWAPSSRKTSALSSALSASSRYSWNDRQGVRVPGSGQGARGSRPGRRGGSVVAKPLEVKCGSAGSPAPQARPVPRCQTPPGPRAPPSTLPAPSETAAQTRGEGRSSGDLE